MKKLSLLLLAFSLSAFGADDQCKTTPLIEAVEKLDIQEVENLLKASANTNETDCDGNTPLMFAATEGNYRHFAEASKIADLLLAKGAKIDLQNNGGYSALYKAASALNHEFTKKLISLGANVNLESKDKKTALIDSFESPEMLKTLLDAKADIHHVDELGTNVLWWAVSYTRYESIEFLVKRGAKLEQKLKTFMRPEEAMTVLMWAQGDFKTVETLIKLGANVNAVSSKGNTALMFAATDYNFSPKAIQALIKANANLNIQNEDGDTALMKAVIERHYEMVEILLENKANPHLKNQEGFTAYDIASSLGYTEMAELIKQHM